MREILSQMCADQGECAVCSPPQAVAQVMIQSFQLSSCALFNAQMQDVSGPHPPASTLPSLRSVSLHLWPILRCERSFDRIACDGSVLQLRFKCDTCKHGRCCVVFTVLVVLSLSLSRLLLSIFPPPVHKCSTCSLCTWYSYYIAR